MTSRTNVIVEMDLTKPEIASDSTPSTTNNSSFADISEINNEHTPYSPFMTLEHNICILDGSLDVFDSSSSDLSYFSNTLSNNDCTTTDKVTVTFNNSHSLVGFVFDLEH